MARSDRAGEAVEETGATPGTSDEGEEGTAEPGPDDRPDPCEELMFRSSDDTRRSYIAGIQAFQLKPVEYAVLDGLALFEGDIVLGTADELESRRTEVEGPAADSCR